jgi:hypothetical protein
MSTLFESAYIAIRWESDINALFVEYKQFVQGEPWRKAMDKLIELATRKQATSWIVDMRAQKVFDEDDERYLQKQLMPRFAKIGIRRIAIVMSDTAMARLGANRVVREAESRMKGELKETVDTVSFATIEEARAYIASQSKAA